MNIFVIFMAVFNCLLFDYVECTSGSFSQTNYNSSTNFAQNLTEAINKVLGNDEYSIHRTVIQEALKWSPLVYYETDLLLNNIEDITPVIDLLNELKPDGTLNPKIILSLNYLNKTSGKFLWHRMADVYYNLNATISHQTRNKILNSVIAIAVNFVSRVPWDRYFVQYGYCPGKVNFTSYVKDFTNLYFGKNTIQVGLIYNDNSDSDYHPQKTLTVDFLIYYKEIHFTWNFPIFIDHFSGYMAGNLRYVLSNASIFINTKIIVPEQYLSSSSEYSEASYYIKGAAYATEQNKNVTKNFITKLYKRAGSLFNYRVLSWASMQNRSIVLGNVMQNLSGEIFMNENSRSKMIIPYVLSQDTNEEIQCSFSKYGESHETVLLDEEIWWKLSRFLNDPDDDLQLYNEKTTDNITASLVKVLLQFLDETIKNWIHMENYMTNLIDSYSTINNFYLDTILFKEEILRSSTVIQKFVYSTNSKYKIGCSIQFDRVRSILYSARSSSNKSENYYKSRLQSELCSPVFKFVKVMVWLTSDYGKLGALFSYYSDLSLAREIVLSHFPNITILIQLPPNRNIDKRVIADLYNVPIVVPSSEI